MKALFRDSSMIQYFSTLAFFINRHYLGSSLIRYILFYFCFEFAKLYEFEIRSVLWATVGNQIFFCKFQECTNLAV
jgi:hypothetical protein